MIVENLWQEYHRILGAWLKFIFSLPRSTTRSSISFRDNFFQFNWLFWNSAGNWGEFQILTNRQTDTTTGKIMLRLVIWPSMMLYQVMELEIWLRQPPPKPYKLKIFYQFCDNCKICHAPTIWKKLFAHCKEYHRNHKHFKSLHDFGGCFLKIRDVCMDFEPYFKVHSLVSIHS